MNTRQVLLIMILMATMATTIHATESICTHQLPPPRISRTDQKAVFMRSGLSWSRRGEYAVVLVTPIALGGTTDLGNLIALPIVDAARKAKIDTALVGCVCTGAIPIGQAELIAHRWNDADPEKPCLPIPRIGR